MQLRQHRFNIGGVLLGYIHHLAYTRLIGLIKTFLFANNPFADKDRLLEAGTNKRVNQILTVADSGRF